MLPSPATVRLPPDAASVSAARRHIRLALAAGGRADWSDDAELAVSELVTNAVLHARTDCEVVVTHEPDRVLVAVRDFSPSVLLERHFSEHATTGRGLRLVAGLGADFGIDGFGPDGKVVWFSVDGTTTSEPEGIGPEWDLDGLDLIEDEVDAVIVLPAVPVTLWLAALEHQAAVLRELYLVRAAHPVGPDTLDLAAADRAHVLLATGTDRAGRAAPVRTSSDGTKVMDVTVVLAAQAGTEMFGHFQVALDLGRDLAREGLLLLRPPLPEVVSLRDWACDQVVAQVHGVPPTAWDGALVDTPHLLPPAAASPRWDDEVVRTSALAVVAADDSNRMVAVSPAAAALLGYEVHDLVGHRVTTIVPPALRQQHVAGFTRYLTTGVVSVLGRRLDLPVLHADGSQHEHSLRFEARAAGGGRQVFLAWIDA